MLNKIKAQSLLEYSIIAIVVIGAIIAGGPFLVNSINARFKGMDNTVQDAFSENIKQGPLPEHGIGCNCDDSDPSTWPNTGECGDGIPPNCNLGYRLHTRICEGHCATEWGCVFDLTCCNAPAPITGSACGTLLTSSDPDMIQGLPNVVSWAKCLTRNDLEGFPPDAGFRGTCTNAPMPNCAIGEKIWGTLCGTTPYYACKPDPNCMPSCWGNGTSQPFQTPAGVVSADCNGADITDDLPHEVARRRSHPLEQPLRRLDQFIPGFHPDQAGAWQVIYAYVPAADCSADRSCERTCPPPGGTMATNYYPICPGVEFP